MHSPNRDCRLTHAPPLGIMQPTNAPAQCAPRRKAHFVRTQRSISCDQIIGPCTSDEHCGLTSTIPLVCSDTCLLSVSLPHTTFASFILWFYMASYSEKPVHVLWSSIWTLRKNNRKPLSVGFLLILRYLQDFN